jgi:membrane protease YdiL (CAAX protease family)
LADSVRRDAYPYRLERAGGVLMSERRTGRGHGIGPDPGTSSSEPGNWAARHDLLLYFTLAYLLSWALWPLVILNPTSSPLVPFGPLIAAAIVSLLAGGPKELWALLRQLTRWRVHPIWYLIALLGPFVMAVVAAALAVAMGTPMRRSGAYTDLGAVGFTLLSTMVIVGLFEEVGWRGFALPRMQRRLDAIWAALLLGVVWALWHLPELISDPTRQRPPLQFVVWTLALSVILSWLYNSTNGSLLIVIICHGAIDTAGRYMLPEFSNQGYQVVWWCMVGLYIVIAIIVVFAAGPKRLETRIPRFSARD